MLNFLSKKINKQKISRDYFKRVNEKGFSLKWKVLSVPLALSWSDCDPFFEGEKFSKIKKEKFV